jgi:3-oxoadipate enol-lactonase
VAKPALKAALLSPQRPLGDHPLLVVGPSLGTSTILWNRTASVLGKDVDVVAWDLPGHGVSPAATSGFTVDEIAEGVLRAADDAGLGRFAAAGVSLGGIVSLALGLSAPERVTVTTMVCSLPKIGSPETWVERAAQVRASGTPSLVQGASQRWFAPGFIEAAPTVASPLLNDLMDVDDESYALCVEALGAVDLRSRVRDLLMPFHVIAGAVDPVIPLDAAEEAVASARTGKLHIIADASHLAAVEKPAEVAAILLSEVPL